MADALGIQDNKFRTVEKQVEVGATLFTVFTDLARDYPEFKKKVYNPETGKISDQFLLLFNESLAQFNQVKSTPLNDKDTISLIPIICGG
jgi:molybdopterin converting factor small subunit